MEAALITGSRGWTDAAFVDRIVRTYEFIAVGCAKGADAHARASAKAHGCMLKVFTAGWSAEPRRAGFIRNVAMVDFCKLLQSDGLLVHCHAFWDGYSPGTRHCGSEAERAGLPTTWHLVT